FAISYAGDVNGDGRVDLLVGAAGEGNNTGRVYLISGTDGAVLRTFDGDAVGDLFGTWVSDAGDLDADGFADVMAGSTGEFLSGSMYTRIFSGIDGHVIRTLPGIPAASSVGDVDADGIGDLLITTSEGSLPAVAVLSGRTLDPLYEVVGPSENS